MKPLATAIQDDPSWNSRILVTKAISQYAKQLQEVFPLKDSVKTQVSGGYLLTISASVDGIDYTLFRFYLSEGVYPIRASCGIHFGACVVYQVNNKKELDAIFKKLPKEPAFISGLRPLFALAKVYSKEIKG